MNQVFKATALGVAIIMAGCATTSTVIAPETTQNLNAHKAKMQQNKVGVFSSGCGVRSEITGTFVVKKISQDLTDAASKAMTDALEKQGVSIAKNEADYLCISLKNTDQKNKIASDLGEEPVVYTEPFIVGDGKTAAPIAQDLQKLIDQVYLVKSSNYTSKDYKIPKITLDDATRSRLTAYFGTPYVWFSTPFAYEQSLGRKVAINAAGTLVAFALVGVPIFMVDQRDNGTGITTAVVDLETQEVPFKASGYVAAKTPLKNQINLKDMAGGAVANYFLNTAAPASATNAPDATPAKP